MEISHRLCLVLLLVMFFDSVFSLASMIGVSLRGDGNRILSTSNGAYTMCADHREAKDGKPMPLDFHCKGGYVISKINFVDYGQASGSCGNLKHGKCGASNPINIVEKKCLRKRGCQLFVPDKIFGPSNCQEALKLVVDATCTKT